MCEPLRRLLEFASADPPTLTPEHVAQWPSGEFRRLRRSGFLVPSARAKWVRCDGCDEDHVGRVVWIPGEPARAYISCRANGRVPVSPGRLRRWTIDFAAVASAAGTAIGNDTTPEALLPGRLWRLGSARMFGARRNIYLARLVADRWDESFDARLSSRPRPVVLVAGAATPRGPVPDASLVTLAEVGELAAPFSVDLTAVEHAAQEGGQCAPDAAERSRTLKDTGWYTHIEIADAHGLPHEAVRRRLGRLRKTNSNLFREIANPPANTPKFEYRYGMVRHVLVKRAPHERPPDVRRKGARARRGPRKSFR